MKKCLLYNTDLKVSNICLGTTAFGITKSVEESFEILDLFLEGGGNFIDTANVYGRWGSDRDNKSEQVIGAWLKARNAYKEVVVATKGGHFDFEAPSVSRVTEADIRRDLDESLATLGLSRIDFYWLHRDNPDLPVEYIIDLMEALVSEGKIRFYGASNYPAQRLFAAKEYSRRKGYAGFSAVSNQWSLAGANVNSDPDPSTVRTGAEEYRFHLETKTPLIPYTATARGFFDKLSRAKPEITDGKILSADLPSLSDRLKNTYLNERNLRIYEELAVISKKTGFSVQALSLAYLLCQPFQVIPITSVSNTAQFKDIFHASDIILESGIIEKYKPQE
ncbi:MAG: General stress protein 69 [Firmicutes bacterium ADurb.Bin193]|nr:MAG: General stress protein 69 [Firmicutes bacterium ADurb.Bin193]